MCVCFPTSYAFICWHVSCKGGGRLINKEALSCIQLRLQSEVRALEDDAIDEITTTPSSSSGLWRQAAAAGRHFSAASATTGNRSLAVPVSPQLRPTLHGSSTLHLTPTGAAEVMTAMFVTSMAQQAKLTEMWMGKGYTST